MIKSPDNQSNEENDDDFEIASSNSTNFSMDESASQFGSSKTAASTPSSNLTSTVMAELMGGHRDAGKDVSKTLKDAKDSKLFLKNQFLSQLEKLEKMIWKYKQETPIANKNKNHSTSLPNEIIFKILLYYLFSFLKPCYIFI